MKTLAKAAAAFALLMSVAGCDPKSPSFVPGFLKGVKPFAIVKGIDINAQWYFYYNLDANLEDIVTQAHKDMPKTDGWRNGVILGRLKFVRNKNDNLDTVSIASGLWGPMEGQFYKVDEGAKGVAVLIIQGRAAPD